MDQMSENFFNDESDVTFSNHNFELLRGMGFCDDNAIKHALNISKNDINEAVAILTNEKLPKLSALSSHTNAPTNNNNNNNNIQTNTNTNEIVMNSESNSNSPTSINQKDNNSNDSICEINPLIFPYDCLVQLENNVFTDDWSIPYKKDEWLDRLLNSSIALIKEGLADDDVNCKRFLDRVIPEVYRKLLDSMPVGKWNAEIQQGVYNMTCLCVEMIAIRLNKTTEVPEILLETLNLIFNSESMFHNKNSAKVWDKHTYVTMFDGLENVFTKDLDRYGWLLNLINIFAYNKGFDGIKQHLEKSTDLNKINILLKPIATCCEYLNVELIKTMLTDVVSNLIKIIERLENDDFKDKNVGRVFNLITTMKQLCSVLWPNDLENFHTMHLNVVLNMLKYSHFNSKMNSLKEICKLIESSKNAICRSAIDEDKLSEWIVNKSILSLAVEGNIDQVQYSDKIKTIVEFIGDRIRNEEISALWKMQFNKSISIIENLYIIIGMAATKFNTEQLDFLIAQVIQTWNDSSFKLHDKLVGLLRIIGRESKSNKTYSRILDALWELKNRSGLSKQLLLLIFSEHLNVLNGGRMPRDNAKANYVRKCCADLQKCPGGTIAIASLKHMYDILNSYQKNGNKSLKEVLHENVVPLMKTICSSLSTCHANVHAKAQQTGRKFDETILADDIFTHEEVVKFHLQTLKFIVKEGNMYLNYARARDVWDTLITNELSCPWDKETGYEWFIECWDDLNEENRTEIFKKKILLLNSSLLTQKGYECFRLYFLRVNETESKLQCKNDLDSFNIDKLDLVGLNYLWDVILYTNDEKIAEMATKFLLDLSYDKVSAKLKREVVQLHQRFINECYTRLENCLITLDTNPMGNLLLNAFKIAVLATGMSDVAAVNIAPRSEIFKCIERLLMIAEKYILAVEESISYNRATPPHYLSYKGESFYLSVINGQNKGAFDVLACANQTLGDLRQRIASHMNVQPSSLLIYNQNEKYFTHDFKLLSSLGIDGMQPVYVKLASTFPSSSLSQTPVKDQPALSSTSTSLFNCVRYDPEQEKSLPGVLISKNSYAFDMFSRLEDFNVKPIKQRIRNLLKLIPTNPKLVEAFDSMILKTTNSSRASVAAASLLVKSPSTSSMTSAASSSSLFVAQSQDDRAGSFSTSTNPSQTSLSTPCTPTTSNLTHTFSKNQRSVLESSRAAVNSRQSTSTLDIINLEKYFDKTSQPLSRILYNLEALSSRLMPSTDQQNNKQDTFQQDFLKADGLKVLVSLLRLDSGACNVDDCYEIKQDIYILLLQLLHLLIFGSCHTFSSAAAINHNKRPSSEPLSNCNAAKKTITQSMVDDYLQSTQNMSFLNLNKNQQFSLINENCAPGAGTGAGTGAGGSSTTATNTCSVNAVIHLVEKMCVSDVSELISQLLALFWSAAAGNIELASVGSAAQDHGSSKASLKSSNATLADMDEHPANTSQPQMQFQQTPDIDLTTSKETNSTQDIQIESSDLNSFLKKEVKFFIPESQRLSTGSNMSTSSVESGTQSASSSSQLGLGIGNQLSSSLQNGVCIRQKNNLSIKDIKIASKSIEIISCFVQHRKDCLPHLLSMKLFNDCVLDTLIGSISSEVRGFMEKFLLKLIQIETADVKCKDHLINLIIKSRLPLWIHSTLTRSSNQRIISQSSQYFNLRCIIFENMTIEEQSAYAIDLAKMLNDEINWFSYFTPSKSLKHIDNVLLTGHLCLLRSLLTCETANKSDIGEEIIDQLIKFYLFPASYSITFPSDDACMEPICSSESSRTATYKLFVELSRNCIKNYKKICQQLVRFHHGSLNQANSSNEWNLIPLVTPRAECGFVGLKNAGATCYMNAVLQQLFMIPGISHYILNVEDESDDKNASVFWQLQNVFAHLKESKLEYYVPEPFWKAFRMWGQEVNLREQQDAFDFFISLTDQIDENLKKIKKEPIFKNVFEGTFSNQFICKDCPHKYEREEVFLGLNLPIKSGNLQESLLQFVKDELLDGENSYNCELCNEKRSAIKRTCIKKLPKYLCIQLKRFDYDWETNRSLKFDDYFQFPRSLNVSPYIYDNINKKDEQVQRSCSQMSLSSSDTKLDHANNSPAAATVTNDADIIYDLVGIIVHSGQANAGHYYSFIKGSKSNELSVDQELYELEQLNQSIDDNLFNAINQSKMIDEKWYKFNDTQVEEFNLTDQALMEECFGGTFTQASDFKMLPEERIRCWNGYMLFYREPDYNLNLKQDNIKKMTTVKQRREIIANTTFKSHDSLSELAELISKGDEKGLFKTGLPPQIEHIVKTENLEFCKNRAIYDQDYFEFIFSMAKIFKDIDLVGENKAKESELFAIESANLSLEFLYNTYFKTGKKLRVDLNKWLDLLKELLFSSKEGAVRMLNFIVNREANSSFIRHFLLECPINEIREACQQLFEFCLSSLILRFEFHPLSNPKIASLIGSLVQLLDKAVIDLCKNSQEYFKLLYVYANMSKDTAQHLISLSVFNKLFCFLLGNPGQIKAEEPTNRRWSTMQLKEFGIVHELIASLALQSNILSLKTCEMDELPVPMTPDNLKPDESINDEVFSFVGNNNPAGSEENKPKIKPFKPAKLGENLLPISQEMQLYLFGALSSRYLRELVFAFEQINQNSLTKALEMILTCCYCNENFSDNIIHQILININNTSSNDIKQALNLLNNIILIEDQLQLKRLCLALDGYKDSDETVYNGLLTIVRQNQSNDAKKSYHCVKFIVTLANQSATCRDYLLKTASNWEWSVNWLKLKMSESISNYMNWNNSKFPSNEDSEIRTFQRTKSAQRTLDDATALLRSTDIDI